MSEPTDWSRNYAAWRLFEAVLKAEGRAVTDLNRVQLLDLYSDCLNAARGEYTIDLDEDVLDEVEDDVFEDDDDDD